jgi:hypothetical protein
MAVLSGFTQHLSVNGFGGYTFQDKIEFGVAEQKKMKFILNSFQRIYNNLYFVISLDLSTN